MYLDIQSLVMEKSIYSFEADVLSRILKRARKEKNLTQVEVARRLKRTQSFISKIEHGETMIDAVALFLFCRAIELPFSEFAAQFEAEWERETVKDVMLTNEVNGGTKQ